MPFLINNAIAAIIEFAIQAPIDGTWNKAQRDDRVIRILQKVGLDPERPPDDQFETLYTYALVEWGVFKPEELLNLFRDQVVRDAFERAMQENQLDLWRDDVHEIVATYREQGKFTLDYNPEQELDSFSEVFERLVRYSRAPADVKRDHTLQEIYDTLTEIRSSLEQPSLDEEQLTGGDDFDIASIHGAAIAVGRDASATVHGGIHFYSKPGTLDTLPLNLRTNIQNFLLHYLGTDTHAVPFGGRDDDLNRLESWRTESENRFLLLVARAGRGKSALLARWAQRLSQPDSVENLAVVFVPVSIRFNTNLPELFFPCLAVQLSYLLGEAIPPEYLNMPPGFWQNLVGEYLGRPLPDGRQLLVIVDGLDEAAWNIGPDLFPLDLPISTKVVVSARYFAGDAPGPEPWLDR
jgi:hypothetical protein